MHDGRHVASAGKRDCVACHSHCQLQHSYNDTREAPIEAIENGILAAYPNYEIRRTFTAQAVINILAERDGVEIDNMTERST